MDLEPSLINDTDTGDSDNTLILRILNGALKGCEFQLTTGKTLVLIGDPNTEQASGELLNIPENSIYIPALEGANNFEILIDADSSIRLRILGQDGSQESACTLNSVQNAGTLSFAIKSVNEEWAHAVLNPSTSSLNGPALTLSDKSSINVSSLFLIAGIALTLVLGFLGYQWLSTPKHQYSNTLATLLQGSSQKIDVLEGGDQVLYVFTNSDRDMAWAKQIIVRSNFNEAVKITTYQNEEASIAQKIARDYPDFFVHAIHLTNANRPKIFYSATRNQFNQKHLNQLVQKLENTFPYIQKAEFIPISDKIVVDQANTALDKLGIQYVRRDHHNGVTFLIHGDIEDSNLQKVSAFVDNFNKQWDGNYVQFSIELKDDAFPGKSFLHSNTSSYVKLNPGSWYFLQPY